MTTAPPPGKWIEGLQPQATVLEAARRVLKVRLKGVEQLLPLAARKAGDDVEYVHQLRVVTRRSDAALNIFEGCLKGEAYRKARRRLRKLRRAAADARACDVLCAALEADRREAPEGVSRVLELVLRQLREERREAQQSLRAAAKRHASGRRLRRARRKLLSTLRAPRESPEALLADAAAESVPGLVDALAKAAAGDLSDLEQVHELRISGKRLRYALEVFAPCFGEGFAEAYAEVEALQETLGAINDSHDLVVRIEALSAEASGDDAAFARDAVEHYRRRRDGLVASFQASWAGGDKARLFVALERLRARGDAAAVAAVPGADGHGAAQ